jgi:tRNA A-37 threonylcarbamoyl transferase component Bud32
MAVPYRQRNVWKGEIRVRNGWIEKDYGAAPFFSRLYGRICLHYEAVALRRLNGVKGVPVYLGRPTRNSIRMTRLPGIPLDKLKTGELSELCFHRLQDLIHAIHGRGVAHGDLHMRNILIHGDQPSIIDFSVAYVRGRLPILDKGFFRIFMLLDLERLYKIEKTFLGTGTPPKMFYLYRLIKGVK